MTEVAPELERLRREIDAIDGRIVTLLGERFAFTEAVGRLKSAHGLPAIDAAREARQMARFAALAAEHDLDAGLVQRVFRLIVDQVVVNHKQLGAPADR